MGLTFGRAEKKVSYGSQKNPHIRISTRCKTQMQFIFDLISPYDHIVNTFCIPSRACLHAKSWSAHLSIVVDYDKEYNPDYGQNEEQNSHDLHAVNKN